MQLNFDQLTLSPGSEVDLSGISWQQFEKFLSTTERRSSRIAYNGGVMRLMSPSVEHEYDKKFLAYLVEALLDTLELEFVGLGSVTIKQPIRGAGAEPDECYYIQNAEKILGKSQIDLLQDPPPDLVIEIDVSSKTDLTIYQAFGVPEVWLYKIGGLFIYTLEATGYRLAENSECIPVLGLSKYLSYCVERSKTLGRRTVMREFRIWLAHALEYDSGRKR